VLGEGLSKAGAVSLLPRFSIPLISQIPLLGPIFFADQSVLVYIGFIVTPLAWYFIYYTRPGMHLRAIGEYPAAADALRPPWSCPTPPVRRTASTGRPS